MPGTELDHGTWTKLALITGRARREPNCQFTSLAHLLDEEFWRTVTTGSAGTGPVAWMV